MKREKAQAEREAESTEARGCVGLCHSSDEAAVMAVERRA